MQAPAQPIHIVCPFTPEAKSGVWWHALGLYEALKREMRVELWSEQSPAPELAAFPIRTIRPFQGEAPYGGTLVFIGLAQLPGLWYEHASPRKVVLDCTMFAPSKVYTALHRLMLDGKREVEVGYCSTLMQQLYAVPGRVSIPAYGMEPFLAVERIKGARPFAIGKASRDTLEKHHFRDAGLYRQWVAEGFRVNIVGGTCLQPYMEGELDGLQLLPEMPRKDLPDFFARQDCFFYRTPLHCVESIGMVVLEAMASGLPVVAQRYAGYRDVIEHGINGYLFETDEEALEIVRHLSRHPDLAGGVGRRARETVSGLMAQAAAPVLAEVKA